MQLSQLRDRVRHLASIRSTALLSDTDIDEAINAFNYMLVGAYDWPQLAANYTVTPSSQLVVLPSDAAAVTGVQVELGRAVPGALRRVGQLEFDQLTRGQEGIPEVYLVDTATSRITLYPKPSTSVTVRIYYTKKPTVLSAATDVPFVDAEFHLAWAEAAAASVIRERGGDLQRAAGLDGRVRSSISRMRKRYLMNSDREPLPPAQRWS